MANTETAILAGGCFWGMQDLIRKLPGVTRTRVGYSGGDVPNATYRNHGTHAEAIEVVFDPSKLSYRELLELFFQIHDPTTKNRQGNDVGTSYRSGIYYLSDEQRRVAEDTIADVDASGLWPGPVVTEVRAGRGRSGKPSPSTRTTCCAIPAATRATFRGRTGSCRGARARGRRDAMSTRQAPTRRRVLRWSQVVELAQHGNVAPPRRVEKSDAEWRAQLTAEQYDVARRKGTERPFSSELCSLFEPGRYHCICCDTPLFDSTTKFDSGRAGRASRQPLTPDVVAYHLDDELRHAAHRDQLQRLRRAFGPRVSRRPAAERPAVLHQRRVAAQGAIARFTPGRDRDAQSLDQREERLAFLDDIGCELGRVAGADVLRRMDRRSRNEKDVAGLGLDNSAVDLVLPRPFDHIDDLFARMRVARKRISRVEIDAYLHDLTSRHAEVLSLQLGAFRSRRLRLDDVQCHGACYHEHPYGNGPTETPQRSHARSPST